MRLRRIINGAPECSWESGKRVVVSGKEETLGHLERRKWGSLRGTAGLALSGVRRVGAPGGSSTWEGYR